MRILTAVAALFVALPIYAEETSTGALPGRLKFKDGPVCMCSTGLNENDIRAALKAREIAAKSGFKELNQQTETFRRGEKEEQ